MFFGVRLPEYEPPNWTIKTLGYYPGWSIENKRNIEQLKNWSLKEGSDLLKARIEEGFEWEDLAETEWCDKYVEKYRQKPPNGYVHVKQSTLHECLQPSLQQIEGFRLAKQTFSRLSGFSKIDIVSFSINNEKCLDDWAYRVRFMSPSGKISQILIAPF